MGVVMDKIKVKYIGDRTEWRDNLYGSGGVWQHGSVCLVSADAAERLLKHPEFERADAAKRFVEPEIPDEEEINEEPPLANLESMTKEQMAQYAHRNFGVVLQKKDTAESMRNTIRLQMGRKIVPQK